MTVWIVHYEDGNPAAVFESEELAQNYLATSPFAGESMKVKGWHVHGAPVFAGKAAA